VGTLEHVTRHPPAAWLALVVAALVIGWLAATAWLGTAPLRYVGTVEGTVSLVNEDGTKLCVEPDGGGAARCGVVYRPSGARSAAPGEHVSVAVAVLRAGNGLDTEVFVLLAPVD
jgi:hypothetical protein